MLEPGQTPPEGEEQTPPEGEEQTPPEGEKQTPPEGEEQTPPEGEQTPPEGEQTPPEGEEPPTRKNNLAYIIERKQAKIEKLKNKTGTKKLAELDAEIAKLEGRGEENPNLSLEEKEKERIDEYILNKYGDQFDLIRQTQENSEINQLEKDTKDFVGENPIFKPFYKKIIKWGKHPVYKNLPIEQLAYSAAGKDLLQIGAHLARNADKQAKESQSGGTSARSDGSIKKDFSKMSDQEFAKELNQVNRRGS